MATIMRRASQCAWTQEMEENLVQRRPVLGCLLGAVPQLVG